MQGLPFDSSMVRDHHESYGPAIRNEGQLSLTSSRIVNSFVPKGLLHAPNGNVVALQCSVLVILVN